jgi:hypothetical protein
VTYEAALEAGVPDGTHGGVVVRKHFEYVRRLSGVTPSNALRETWLDVLADVPATGSVIYLWLCGMC